MYVNALTLLIGQHKYRNNFWTVKPVSVSPKVLFWGGAWPNLEKMAT